MRLKVQGLRFQISSFGPGFRVLVFVFRISGFRFRVRVPGFRFKGVRMRIGVNEWESGDLPARTTASQNCEAVLRGARIQGS